MLIFSYILLGAFISFVTFGVIWVRHMEKKDWNNGVCPICNNPWEIRGLDSWGDRLYVCKCNHHCWISYNVDKK
jgi:hypothetical protein